MNNIDWSKAPDWAKGHGLISDTGPIKQVWYGDAAYMILGDSRSYPFGGGAGDTMHNHTPSRIQFKTMRPEPWNGEGNPPVETVCEFYRYDGAWIRCKIKVTDFDGLVIKVLGDDSKLTARLSLLTFEYGSVKFRPIRTPEQIAADEREDAIQLMLSDLKNTEFLTSHYEVCESLYQAGYRKQVTP